MLLLEHLIRCVELYLEKSRIFLFDHYISVYYNIIGDDMKNKNGFTLVELLAVIAILAILVIIALPNVINMYTTAKKNTFVSEAKAIAKSVSNKYISESMKGNKISEVSNSNNPLDINKKSMSYIFELDNNGKITRLVVSNDEYCISTNKDYNELTNEDIKTNCTYEEIHNIAGTLIKRFYEKSGRTDRSLVNSVTFYSDGRKIDADEVYDVSEENNNSVLMYILPVSNSSLLDIFIVANGKISFPQDSSYLLSFFKMNGCSSSSNITSIVFNNSVITSKVTNMSHLFAQAETVSIDCLHWAGGCYYSVKQLNNLDLSGFDTKNVINMYGMFMGNQSLKLDVSNLNTENVTDMSYMFNGVITDTLDLSNFNTSKVTTMNRMFADTKKLKLLNLSNFNTVNVKDMSYMFYYSYVPIIDISSFDTSNVTNMGWMFASTESTKIKGLDRINTSSVTNMDYMFAYTVMDSLILTNFNTSKVTSMNGMFCNSDASVINVSSFNTSNVKTMTGRGFHFCGMFESTKVKTLDLSSFDTSNVTDMFYMFKNTKATSGYARTQEDANRFNNTSNIPSTLKFIVK